MTTKKFRPGDIYEDCKFHPCLCVAVEGDDISGISLIDGSQPRSCSLSHCGVRKLSIEEVLLWKKHGPQDMPEGSAISPENQWWWPKLLNAINPGSCIGNLFKSSLNFVKNNLREQLGDEIYGWSQSSVEFDDALDSETYAKASYTVTGSKHSARVSVEAKREGRLWPISRISVVIDGEIEPLIFEGEHVRGCGYAS